MSRLGLAIWYLGCYDDSKLAVMMYSVKPSLATIKFDFMAKVARFKRAKDSPGNK